MGADSGNAVIPRAYARGGLGLTPPLEVDILQKLYYEGVYRA